MDSKSTKAVKSKSATGGALLAFWASGLCVWGVGVSEVRPYKP